MQYDDRRHVLGLVLAVIGVALLVSVISGGVAGALVAVLVRNDESGSNQPRAAATRAPSGPSTVLSLTEESAVTKAVQKTLPGIVTLVVEAVHTDNLGRTVPETNLGSGVVVDARGYILTNQHVVENARKITVKLSSGEERPGALVGDDSPFTDLAVVRVQPDNLTAITTGDSDALVLGEQVIALGSVAFGANLTDFRNNVTRGIVSGLHRRWPRDDVVMEDLIQTDAAINHGNSGGALINLNGELVGITTTVVRATENGFQVQGVAFAIPSKTFAPVVDALIRTGRVERPDAGLLARKLSADCARQAGVQQMTGACVADVAANGPAAKAGLRRGDVIVSMAGTEISDDNPFLNVLIQQRPNSTIPVTYIRNGQKNTVDLTIGLRQ